MTFFSNQWLIYLFFKHFNQLNGNFYFLICLISSNNYFLLFIYSYKSIFNLPLLIVFKIFQFQTLGVITLFVSWYAFGINIYIIDLYYLNYSNNNTFLNLISLYL